MKKKYGLLILLCVVLLLTSCEIIMQPAPTNTSGSATQENQITAVPLATQEEQVTQAGQTTPPATTDAPQSDPTPYNTMEFYSCYAFMVSYDPSTGWAEFDYFYMLTGQDAIDYLVDHEGYSQADAEDMVNDFADGEYVCRNNNTTLRTIDLDTVPIKLMYHADGTQVTDSISIDSTSADVAAVYALNPNYLFEYFFFYIHCDSDGNITLVEQIYWC